MDYEDFIDIMRTKIKPTLRFILYCKQNKRCIWCNQEMYLLRRDKPRDLRATLEHLVPKSQGGKVHLSNIVVACNKCNNRREDRMTSPHDDSKINPQDIIKGVWKDDIDDVNIDNPKWKELYEKGQQEYKEAKKTTSVTKAAA